MEFGPNPEDARPFGKLAPVAFAVRRTKRRRFGIDVAHDLCGFGGVEALDEQAAAALVRRGECDRRVRVHIAHEHDRRWGRALRPPARRLGEVDPQAVAHGDGVQHRRRRRVVRIVCLECLRLSVPELCGVEGVTKTGERVREGARSPEPGRIVGVLVQLEQHALRRGGACPRDDFVTADL